MNKIEWKKFGDIATFISGRNLLKKDLTESGVPAIHYGQIYNQYNVYTDTITSFTSKEFASNSVKAQSGDLIIGVVGFNSETLCRSVAWIGEGEVVVSENAYICKHNLNPLYI